MRLTSAPPAHSPRLQPEPQGGDSQHGEEMRDALLVADRDAPAGTHGSFGIAICGALHLHGAQNPPIPR